MFSVSHYESGVHITKMVFAPNKQGKYRIICVSLTLQEVDSLPENI
jgi:heme/copper-type cytochrome/quinol oxidase subunit 2